MTTDHITRVPLADSADPKAVASLAIDYHLSLIRHLTNSVQPGGTPPRVIGCPMDPIFFRVLLTMLQEAEIVLWRRDLQQHAKARAEDFMSTVVEEDLLQPSRPELWMPYPLNGDARCIQQMGLVSLSRLLVPISKETMPPVMAAMWRSKDFLLSVDFLSPTQGDAAFLDLPPSLLFEAPLILGQPPGDFAHAEVLSCLTFRRSAFIVEPQIHPDRAVQRRLKRQRTPPPSVRIVQLRKKERSPGEQPHLSDHEYQCRFMVRAHVRRPNPRMKFQRPIWVAEYIKGPSDKPLKPPTRTVSVVRR